MLVNRYILESIITGEVIVGTRAELEVKGFDGNQINDAIHRKYLLNQEWVCQVYEKISKPKKKEQKQETGKKLTIDEVQKLAREAGMHYGEYVATHNL